MIIKSHEEFTKGYAIKYNNELHYCSTVEELAEHMSLIRGGGYLDLQYYTKATVYTMITPSRINSLPKWLAPILVVKTRNVNYIGSKILQDEEL